ncbi:uncharacterized protein LOC114161420 [Xiphophorus couchianus]|uniref:uncharacterized protein LOC114161420 n=1 Tax=Xiphophorus couchianus TaxID=32473 RepID=UPI001016FCF6|nr:uncharacterized protein LOC114161420 [Xiphophorus couchianus]
MAESNKQEKRNIHISIDNLEDIILPRLNTLSPAQWTLLSQGLRDSHITGVMSDILNNIFQHCVENSLTLLVPVMEESIVPGMKSEIPDEDISVHLTNMISTEMATVLEVPPEVCDHGVELNSLMEQEVSEKVTSITNGIKETSSIPQSPAVFASGCISNLKNLNKMVSNTSQCLRDHINIVRSKCAERYWCAFTKKRISGGPATESEIAFDLSEKSVSADVRSIFSVASVCESVTEILEKYSDESGASNGAGDDTGFSLSTDSFEVNEVADGISKTIIDDLHYCKAEGSAAPVGPHCPCAPHFNLKNIVGDIKNLFLSKGKADRAGKKEIVRKPEFSRFASDQFTRMVSSLETSVKDSSETNVVKLKRGAGSPTKLMFFGALSDEERVKLLDHAETDRIPKLDFQSIKPQIERLCAEFMENPQLKDKIKQFEIELSEKIYTDIMRSYYNTLPVPPKIPSDSVLSDEKISDISGQTVICPEVFCARIEDEVRRFIQNIFLWIKNEETNRISETDRMSNAISEINDLVGQIYNTSNQLPRPMCPEPCEAEEERDFAAAVPSEVKEQPQSQLPLKTYADSLIQTEQSLTEASLSDLFASSDIRNMSIGEAIRKLQGQKTETPEQRMIELEEGMACFVMRTVLSCSEENGGPLKSTDMKKILYYLSGEEVEDIADFAISKDNENIKHFVQDLYSNLKSQFGSTEDVWRAATQHGGRPFKGAVISYLKSYVQSTPPKGPVHKFFSAVTKPFKSFYGK